MAELARRLQGQSPALALPLTWLEQRLAETHQTIEQLVQLEAQHQAAEQVSVSNSIGSLRLLAGTDWRDFVEDLSTVERTLRGDPAGVYARMDFATRDAYRHAVETIAGDSAEARRWRRRPSPWPRSRPSRGSDGDARQAHVGYYLVDQGRAATGARVGRRMHAGSRGAGGSRGIRSLVCRRHRRRHRCCRPALLPRAPAAGAPGRWLPCWRWWAWPSCSASQLASRCVNWPGHAAGAAPGRCRAWISPRASRTRRALVVVPTMLGQRAGHRRPGRGARGALPGQPRRAACASRLLTDFHDAAEEHCPGRSPAAAARAGIEALNHKHAGGRGDPAPASSCSTGRAAGTRASASGWATSASAASSRT